MNLMRRLVNWLFAPDPWAGRSVVRSYDPKAWRHPPEPECAREWDESLMIRKGGINSKPNYPRPNIHPVPTNKNLKIP